MKTPEDQQSNKPISFNSNEPPPAYVDFAIPSQEATNDFSAPNYFDISNIPRGSVLYPHTFGSVKHPSLAKFKVEKNGNLVSFDPLLDHNPEEVFSFFATHLPRLPLLYIRYSCSYF
jgi:hypothetical protein